MIHGSRDESVAGDDGASDAGIVPSGTSRSTAPGDPTALDVDGIAVVTLGTVLWAVALVLSLVFETDLRRDGHLWWIATAACGFGLGLLGIAYCVRRRARLGSPATRPPD